MNFKTNQDDHLDIPDKLYFKIGEVSQLIGVEPYVLRYWETEFPEISPSKSTTKQRLYKRNDVELISRIRDLLYHDNFTIKGARQKIQEEKHQAKVEKSNPQQQFESPMEDKVVLQKNTIDVLEQIIGEMDAFIKK